MHIDISYLEASKKGTWEKNSLKKPYFYPKFRGKFTPKITKSGRIMGLPLP
jgi:hypothetical protein